MNEELHQEAVEVNYYEALGVPEKSTPEQIRLAYRRAVKICHPDHNHNDPAATQLFRELTAAYKVLRDPEQRMSFDSSLGLGHAFRPWYSPDKHSEDHQGNSDPAMQPFLATAATLASNGLSASEVAASLIEDQCPYESAWEIAWQARHDQMAAHMTYSHSGGQSAQLTASDGGWHPHHNTLWEKVRQGVSRIFN